MTTARHPVDLERAREGVRRKGEMLASLLASARTGATALSPLLSTAESYAGYLAVAEPESPELCRALRLGARAGAAIATLASAGGEVEIDLGEAHARLPATGPTDAAHPGNWRTAWWMAQVARDRVAIDALAATPVEVLRRSSSRADEYQYQYVAALQAIARRGADWGAKLQAALDATDPGTHRLMDVEYAIDIVVPEMHMLYRFATAEVAPFQQAIRLALARHAKYWSRDDRGTDPAGYLALGPLGVVAHAHDAGMPIEVDSEYAPKRLAERGCP